MSQFESELEANEARAKFDALSASPLGFCFASNILKAVRAVVFGAPNEFDLAQMINDAVSAYRADEEKRSNRESEFLLKSVVLMLKRHDKTIGEFHDRFARLETRVEQGLKTALRLPNDGSVATLERLAIVVVRGAMDFGSNPQEQTNEFLRIASQITESEVAMLSRLYEFQEGLSRQSGHSVNQGNWLMNVMNGWVNMNRKYPPTSDQWMHRKSALVRLESYGFVDRVPGSPTSEGSEMGQAPYALLPLGREFCEYIRPI
jgi:hypothetical protein